MTKNNAKSVVLVNDEVYTLKGNEVFVTMSDKFMSGWGCATNKTAKRVIICQNSCEAYTLRDRLFNPKYGMKYVNITYDLPKYSSTKYTTTFDVYTPNLFNY